MTTLLGHLSALVFLVVEGIKPLVQLGIQGGSQAKGRTVLEARGEKQDALVRRKGRGLPEHKTLMGISSWEPRPDGNAQWVGEGSMFMGGRSHDPPGFPKATEPQDLSKNLPVGEKRQGRELPGG